MNANPRSHRPIFIALLASAAFGPALAEDSDDAVKLLTTPDSVVNVGAATASGDQKDRARFGMFNGMRKDDTTAILDFSYSKRDDASGVWNMISGRNLGLDNRELKFSSSRQGDWKVGAEYSEITRHDPRTINTGLQGAGTTTPTVVLLPTPGAGRDLNLELKRKGTSVSAEKWFSPSLQIEASAKSEDKDGARFFGKGFTCASVTAPGCLAATATSPVTGWALLMLPEPVNSTIRQFEVKLNFSTDRLFLTTGYYGNLYTNANSAIIPTVPGTLLNPLGNPLPLSTGLQSILNLPMALPPDSQSHQFFISGNYRFSPVTNLNFKYARSRATQRENFSSVFQPPTGRANLGGEVDTTLAQASLTTRPIAGLNVLGNIRYEAKDDNTPLDLYNLEGVPAPGRPKSFTNSNLSPKKLTGKLEATVRLPDQYRLVVGADYEALDHGEFASTSSIGGISGIRQKTKERGFRAEIRRSMSETFTGSFAVISSNRNGDSPWLKPVSLSAAVGPITGVIVANPDPACVPPPSTQVNTCIYGRTAIFPFIFMDRQRDKWKATGTFMPTENMSLQFYAEDGRDTYSGPTEHGLRKFGMRMLGADLTYKISDAWNLTAYASYGEQSVDAGHSTGYDAVLKDENNGAGLSLSGSLSPRFQAGLDATWISDVLKYTQVQDPLASANNARFLSEQGGLPDVNYRLLSLRLFGQYLIDKKRSVRVDLIHHRTYFNEWTYNYNGVPFTYNDNTTLNAKETQSVTMVGVSYVHRFP